MHPQMTVQWDYVIKHQGTMPTMKIPINSLFVRFIMSILSLEFLSLVKIYPVIEFLSTKSLIFCLITLMFSELSLISTPLTVSGS
jgi:hypothetical protein